MPHPYQTWQNGPTAGASTFLSSPYYLNQIDKSKIPMPKWTNFSNYHPVDQYATVTKNVSGDWDPEEIKNIRHHYYGMLKEVDEIFGTVLNAIPENIRENTGLKFKFEIRGSYFKDIFSRYFLI